jgi:hypothetical protein
LGRSCEALLLNNIIARDLSIDGLDGWRLEVAAVTGEVFDDSDDIRGRVPLSEQSRRKDAAGGDVAPPIFSRENDLLRLGFGCFESVSICS